jgi:hypothetical protein
MPLACGSIVCYVFVGSFFHPTGEKKNLQEAKIPWHTYVLVTRDHLLPKSLEQLRPPDRPQAQKPQRERHPIISVGL